MEWVLLNFISAKHAQLLQKNQLDTFEKVYAAQQAEANTESAQPSAEGEKTVDGDVVDAEFEEVKKDK